MELKPVLVITLLIYILLGASVPVSSLNTGSFPSNLSEMETQVPLKIQIWSERNLDLTEIENNLPSSIIQESLYPRNNKIDTWQVNLNGKFFGLINNIEYEIVQVDPIQINKTGSSLFNASNFITVNNEGLGGEVSGYSIASSSLHDEFDRYSSKNQYVLHILDIGSYFEGSDHWFRIGDTSSILSSIYDLRNVYDLGDRQLLLDSSAIAPYFGIDSSDIPQSDSGFIDYLTVNTVKLLEEVVLGSPQAFNLLALESSIRVDRINIGLNISDREFIVSKRGQIYDIFEHQVERLFPTLDLTQRAIESDIHQIAELVNIIDQYTRNIDGIPTVLVDNQFSEAFKFHIRDSYYSDFPSRYYYGIFFFVDAERRYMMNVTQGGTITNELVEYNVGEIGFAMDSLKDWYDLSFSELSNSFILGQQLNLLGQNFGMSKLSSNVSMQIDSPMTNYGVSTNWDYQFTQYEVDQVQRRQSLIFYYDILERIQVLRDKLDSVQFFWVDSSGLDKVENRLSTVKTHLDNIEYVEALEEIKEISIEFDQEEEIYQRSTNFLNYGALLLVGVIFLAYYSKILIDDSISKEDLKYRIESHRTYNMEKDRKSGK